MLERESHHIFQSLESSISLPIADALSNNDFDSPEVLGCIGPHLRKHLRMERRESELAVIVGLIDLYIWISIRDLPLKEGLRELVSGTCYISIEESGTGRFTHRSPEAKKDLD